MTQTEKVEILTVVMTYPHPSRGYQELVCTAGITRSGEWVRLYPIDYRYRPREQQFHKYQWIEVELDSNGAGNDGRKESRRPVLDSIKLLGEPLSTRNGWEERRAIIDAMPHSTRKQLEVAYEKDKTSLGIIRPQRILDLEIRDADKEWKPDWKNLFSQMTLFGPAQKPLRKIPYTFHYVFECEDSDKPHVAMCEDWELGVLFLNEAARLESDELAAESVKKKFLGELCREDKDTRLFMGTFFPYNTWLVLGVFWSPKVTQGQLF
jgi:hypothetical protein